MKVIRQLTDTANAVQWLGTPDSLREIQQLLFPQSPLYDGNYQQDLRYRSLGVEVTTAHALTTHKLEHLSVGGWVVRSGDSVELLTDDQFKKLYTPAPIGDVAAPYRNIAPPIMATHPRALSEILGDAQ